MIKVSLNKNYYFILVKLVFYKVWILSENECLETIKSKLLKVRARAIKEEKVSNWVHKVPPPTPRALHESELLTCT